MLLDWLKAAADETRLRLMVICCQGEFTVSELTFILGQSQPRVSRHLKRLCEAGLLLRHKEQNWVFYGASKEAHINRFLALVNEAHTFGQPESQLALFQQDQRKVIDVIAKRDAKAQQILRDLSQRNLLIQLSGEQEQALGKAIRSALGEHQLGALLDIGTGTGRMLRLLGADAKHALGIDISPDMLALARSQIRAKGLAHCVLRHGDMYHLPYPDETFNTITFDTVLIEATKPLQAITEAKRLLLPGGFLVLLEVSLDMPQERPLELVQMLKKSDLQSLYRDLLVLEPFSVALAIAQK